MGLFQKLFGKKPKSERYQLGLHKTKENLGNLKAILAKSEKIDDELFDSLEDIFIQADIGIDTVIYFINELKKDVINKKISDPKDLAEIIVDKMFEIYLKGELVQTDLNYTDHEVNVYLFVGVNGVGKTTTIGKLAKQLKDEGKKIMMVAGDTFRAGAISQLVEWGRRSNTFVFAKEAGSDPSSVIYDALEIAKKEFWDFVKNNPIYSRFYNCFRVFAFGGYDYKNHKGEIVKKTEWSFNRTKYSLNWKSRKIEIWCSENPGMHPIEKFEDDLIKPFQLTYKIENGILKEYLIDRLAKALGNTYSNFDIEIIDCEKANFKTDVDSLLSGISGILNSIKQREIQSRKIKIVFERKGRTRFIKIIHVGSKSIKSFEEEEHDLLQGDLLNVKRSLFCVCDWSIVSENPSNKINQINILYDIKLKKAKESIDDPIEGFTHILTFYS